MKKIILLSMLVLVFGCLSVFAQGRGQGQGGQDRRADRGNRPADGENADRRRGKRHKKGDKKKRKNKAFKGLDLSDDQKHQVRDIQRAGRENGTDRETVHSQIRSAVLTEEQVEKFDARTAKRKEKREKQRQKREKRREKRKEKQDSEDSSDSDPQP